MTIPSSQLAAARAFTQDDTSLDAYSVELGPDKIGEEHLYISGAFVAEALDALQKHGITHILQVGYELEAHHKQLFQYEQLHLADRFDADIAQHLPRAFKFISEGLQSGRVLVHCAHGQSRSASVVIAYLMQRDDMPYRQALQLVRSFRPRVAPNQGFEMQLCLLHELRFDFDQWQGWTMFTFMVIKQTQRQLENKRKICPVEVAVAAAAKQPGLTARKQETHHPVARPRNSKWGRCCKIM